MLNTAPHLQYPTKEFYSLCEPISTEVHFIPEHGDSMSLRNG